MSSESEYKNLVNRLHETASGGLIAGQAHSQACGQQAVDGCDKAAVPQVMVSLSAVAADVLRCLFFHGPTWDGNVPSKSGRDELVNMGLAARAKGWQWLTRSGIDACFANGIELEKERRESRERARRAQLESAARQIIG